MKDFKLRRARKRAQMTQADLAERVGLSRRTLSAYETGAKSPRLDVLFAIAKALKCDVEDLL